MALRTVKSWDDVLHNITQRVSAKDFFEDEPEAETHFIPSGNTTLDVALSNGLGWPCGKVIELFGEEHSGKTTEWILLAIQVQKLGGKVILFNAEGGFEKRLALMHGLNLKKPNFYSYRTKSMEVCLDMLEGAALSAAKLSTPTLLVVDTVAGLCPLEMTRLKTSMSKGKRRVGAESKTMSWFFKRGFIDDIAGTKVIAVFVNQVRSRISTKFRDNGPDYTTPAGKALRFYASLRLHFSESGARRNEAKNIIGCTKTITIMKNKLVGKDRSIDIPVFYNTGWDDDKGILYYCLKNKLFKHTSVGKYKLDLPNSKVKFEGKIVKGNSSWLVEMRKDKSFRNGMRKIVKLHFLSQLEDDDEWLN